ncbi:hypothetical protein ACHAXS_009949 [Conticribra weissflogii]
MGGFHSKPKSTPTTPKKATITPLDRAVLDLKNSRDRLTKYRAKLALDAAKLTARAKTLHSNDDTKMALRLLQLRKHKLREADRVEEQLLNVLRMVDKISEKQNENEVIAAMRRGKDALEILHREVGIEDVLDLMDEVRDQSEVERRIGEALGEEGLRAVGEMGEEEVLRELESLEEEVRLEEGGRKAGENVEGKEKVEEKEDDVVMPEVPSKPLPVAVEPSPAAEKVAVAS